MATPYGEYCDKCDGFMEAGELTFCKVCYNSAVEERGLLDTARGRIQELTAELAVLHGR